MKHIYFLLFICFISIQTIAQKQLSFIPNISIGSNVVSASGIMLSSHNYNFDLKTKFGLNLKASLLTEYSLSERFSVGMELSYHFQYLSFENSYLGAHIPEVNIYHIHDINSHIINIPIVLKYKFKKSYIVGKYGLTSIISSNYSLNRYSYHMNTPKDITVVSINNGSTQITNNNSSFGHFFEIGFGREFSFWNNTFIMEFTYNQDINYWLYTPEEENYINEISFLTHRFSLGFGIKL